MGTKPPIDIGADVNEATLVEQVQNYCINLNTREIWIHGVAMNNDTGYEGIEPGVEYMMANQVIKNLLILKYQSTTRPVIIHLHTCGGFWEEGMAIYDTLRLMPYPITMISYTHARSMSSIILQAADERLMMPHSYFMFHLGTMSFEGEARTFHSNANFDKRNIKTMVDIYVGKALHGPRFKGWSKKEIRNLINEEMEKKSDVFLTPRQAIDWGFADGILTKWPKY